jgi:hypothetical protein
MTAASRRRERLTTSAAATDSIVVETVAIALDAMGGDNAPAMVIKGAHLARKRFPRITFHVFGD